MEAKQFHCTSISPLVLKTFSCKWSEDNRLSVITENGVHILEIIPAPMQANPILKLSRSFIYSPKALPGEIYLKNILDGIFDWKKEDVYSFLMQDAYTPSFPKALKMAPEIIDVFWSPKNLVHSQKCLLAILTSSGAVELALELDRNWISICQLTDSWASVINEELKTAEKELKHDAECLRKQLDRLLITTLTWSPIYLEINDSYYAYLVTAHRNSEIVVWKIDKVLNDITNDDIKANVVLKLKQETIAESIKINALLWINLRENNYLLVIGFFNGQIGVYKLEKLDNEIMCVSYSTPYDDLDNIPIDVLQVLQQTDECVELVAVKGMHLFIITLDVYGKMIDKKFISSPGFSITGVSAVKSNVILITTQEGNLYAVEKYETEKRLICNPIKIDVSKSHIQYLGLASSINKLLFTVVTSPSIMYDHLIQRDPSCIWFFSLVNLTSANALDIIYREESLLNYWDCLELIKINALKYNNFQEILLSVKLDLESLSIRELRVAYWIMIINETLKRKSCAESGLEPPDEIDQAKLYIFLRSTAKYLEHLVLQKDLNDLQTLSMHLLRSHVEIWLAGEEDEDETPLSRCIKESLGIINEIVSIKQEKCNLCDDLITEPWASSCSKGHVLPRCAVTRLQVTCVKFRTCIVCEEIFHPCLDTEMKDVRCLYCDQPAIYKNQLTNSSLRTSDKNLSNKQPLINKNDDLKDD